MKRSSSSLDQPSTDNDDESHQASPEKMVRRSSPRSKFTSEEKTDQRRQKTSMDQRVVRQDLLCSLDGIFLYHSGNLKFRAPSFADKTTHWSPRYSSILGSFSEPPTYVIHFLDPHLTLLQSFQICSLFGRVRIHGYNLQPLTYYSIYNYRINSPLSIESITSTTTITRSLQDIKLFIHDVQLAEHAILNVQQKGGDILLIRKEPNNDSLFIKTIREHRSYNHWFLEKYSIFEGDQWRQLEKDLHTRLIETTDQTVIIPHEQFIETANHITNRWLNEATEDCPFIVLISGEKDMGKSTFTRYLINHALNHINSTFNLTYFDCDIGQCEFTIGGCLSYINLDSPLLGPPCSHMKLNPKPNRLLYYGLVSPQTSPVRYLQYIDKLRQLWNMDKKNRTSKRSMILINTMGWGTGLGLELLKEIVCMCCPNAIIQLGDSSNLPPDRNKMPDITLQWLLQQPVYTPYRRTIQMNHRRQEDYDGQLNYEYIKIQSAVPSSNTTHNDSPKLRARDHRLFATWSYFFSSNLSRISLPWSQLVHVSLLENKNFNGLPDCLEHTIVAFCSSENSNQLRNSAIYTNGIFHSSDYQDECFECLGFGWIERCDKEKQTYEIYTPIDGLTNVNLLISGTFDTPDEFEYMFKSYFC